MTQITPTHFMQFEEVERSFVSVFMEKIWVTIDLKWVFFYIVDATFGSFTVSGMHQVNVCQTSPLKASLCFKLV